MTWRNFVAKERETRQNDDADPWRKFSFTLSSRQPHVEPESSGVRLRPRGDEAGVSNWRRRNRRMAVRPAVCCRVIWKSMLPWRHICMKT